MNRTPFELAKRYILNNTRYRDPQNEFPPFQLNYFVAHIRHNSTLQYHINILTETPEEAQCENHFKTTHSRDAHKRFVVRLPFRKSVSDFDDSRALAFKMLRCMRLTVAKNPVETLAQRESARIFLCTVTYGLACAPYLALRCLQQLAIEAESTRACAAEILHCDTYVDDILSGAYHSYRDSENATCLHLHFKFDRTRKGACTKLRSCYIKLRTGVWDLIKRYSSLTALLRISAWIRRAVERFYKSTDVNAALDFVLDFWIKLTQHACFFTKIQLIKANKPLPKSSPLLRLIPFIDTDELLHLRSRLQHSQLDRTEEHPLILPRSSRLTEIIIDHYHRKSLYGGSQLTFSSIRRQFLVCTRQRAATGQQLMGQLPASRVTPCPLFYDVITLGLCLPASCSTNNISFVLEGIFRDRILLINDLYSVDLNLIQVKNLKDDHQWLLSGAIPFICVALVLTFVMMISGTIYDIFIYQTYLKTNTKTVVNVENVVGEMQMTDLWSSREKSKIRNVLMCFSVYTSTKTIFNTKLDTKEIAVVHGIRFLSMVWIIILHSIFYTVEYFDNKTWMLRLAEGVPIQVISNGSLSIDTYFFLSGFLLTYINLKNKIDKERIKPIHYKEKLNEFFVSIMKRYIRLTPAYIMMIGIAQLISAWYDKTSQFYVEERPHETCAKYWWRNVLYIHNLFGLNTMCLSWSWYLSNDMQFYIIGLVFLILSTVYFYVAVVILGTILIASVILSGYISYIYEYVPTLDEQYRLLDVLYFPPWIQIGPYIIGMITGYIVRRFNKKITLKKNIVILYWTLGAACNIFVLFGLYKRQISVLSSAIYVALSRTGWAIGIAWIVIMCCTKHGG
ncbi:Nose resistant to fluoxetine protein 6 [Trachymyrmex cornetzi]|uniref:Nose resistant to fluoxetine protein 6 n=1 Tax=Trachymyrmex cornetzi TaxID=471704 RepID=A0A151IY77_9HYME|nr:Nose resistant to fluoxetine protein 6 [Trachymyrmex cornetzi]